MATLRSPSLARSLFWLQNGPKKQQGSSSALALTTVMMNRHGVVRSDFSTFGWPTAARSPRLSLLVAVLVLVMILWSTVHWILWQSSSSSLESLPHQQLKSSKQSLRKIKGDAVSSLSLSSSKSSSLLSGSSSTTKATPESDGNITSSTDPKADVNVYRRIQWFRQTALRLSPVTDKVGASTTDFHSYHNMYGLFLLPYAAARPTLKMLEIGLGCNMVYGPGASVALWQQLFPQADLWEAEYQVDCVQQAQRRGQLPAQVHILTGDQADPDTLRRWIRQADGGHFDIIIDDGGHTNCQISTSFDYLWPTLRPGGYYFIEDLHVGKTSHFQDCGDLIMSNRIQEWIDRLLYLHMPKSRSSFYRYTMPDDILFVFCQAEACVVGKRHGPANDPATWADQQQARALAPSLVKKGGW